ncbi:hypothetical protein OG897_27475 [Streptomyces sp. NBC_00237]|uniref:hypothetical protein n=1 Tax=Streptomyces sp. NBC_00237 TaxID=2975687 RepID=UPI0022515C49|nr:hypothetical protein [Streptomyces sp. NBC_00237]MCX5205185.1 hypothetical protein [Streptomyces sp. NBC_00237]
MSIEETTEGAAEVTTAVPSAHRPGRPEDLPPAPVLWARWGVLAGLLTTREREEESEVHRTGFWMSPGRADSLRYDDAGSTWWALRAVGDGRYVLYGEDESSGVKWHEPAIDVLAGAPAWLPFELLRDLIASYEIGCVYWYENGAWGRAPYPGSLQDDGLDCGMSRLFTTGEVVQDLASWLDDEFTDPDAEIDPAVCAKLVSDAVSGALTEEAVGTFLSGIGRPEQETPSVVGVLRRAGLLAEPVPSAEPAE